MVHYTPHLVKNACVIGLQSFTIQIFVFFVISKVKNSLKFRIFQRNGQNPVKLSPTLEAPQGLSNGTQNVPISSKLEATYFGAYMCAHLLELGGKFYAKRSTFSRAFQKYIIPLFGGKQLLQLVFKAPVFFCPLIFSNFL